MNNIRMSANSDTPELVRKNTSIIGGILNVLRNIGKRGVATDSVNVKACVNPADESDYLPAINYRRD